MHIYALNTDVFVLALSVMQHPGDITTLITGSGSNRRHIGLPIMPIYHALGQNRISALIGLLVVISLVVYANLLGGMHSVQLVKM